MSTSLVHVLTVIGKAAGKVEAECDALLSRRLTADLEVYGSDDWPDSDHEAIGEFCSQLISGATELPVVYYTRYLDCWSVADSMFRLLEWPDGKRRQVCGGSFGFAFYPSEFSDALLAQTHALRRRKLYRDQPEDRWFVDQMREALLSAQRCEAPYLVLSITQCLGPSRQDDDIRAALDLSIRSAECLGRIASSINRGIIVTHGPGS